MQSLALKTGMGMAETFQLTVNGTEVEVTCDRDTPLLYVLRNHLDLKGTRFGCGLGLCGACNVIIDGRAVYSCDTPLWSVAGKEIRTVEGLADNPVQRMFVEEQAAQCGYCVSGIVMSATALLEHNPSPDEHEVRTALDNNLCRCGAHNRMVRAVLRASEASS
ncbi:(2Fe-2S)-binding protein [Kibdelosporangium aridum]|uniref:(2Fe-2S)-binding protein n=1 Tax=Kibdelosporangium aridum TaxID=2030 RepID=UPI00190EB097|nr:(2Fe-2S)-binding protein [Kibdelosporangium aridum]